MAFSIPPILPGLPKKKAWPIERSSSFVMVLRLWGLVLLYYRRPVFISHLETGDSDKDRLTEGGPEV